MVATRMRQRLLRTVFKRCLPLLPKGLQLRLSESRFDIILLFRRNAFLKILGGGFLVAVEELFHAGEIPGFTGLPLRLSHVRRAGGSEEIGLGYVAEEIASDRCNPISGARSRFLTIADVGGEFLFRSFPLAQACADKVDVQARVILASERQITAFTIVREGSR